MCFYANHSIAVYISIYIYSNETSFELSAVNQKRFEELLINPSTHFVPVTNGDNFYYEETRKPIYLTASDLQGESDHSKSLFVYLGFKAGIEYIGVDLISEKIEKKSESVTSLIGAPVSSSLPPLPLSLLKKGVKQSNLRSFSEQLIDCDDASLLAHARGMIVWHNNTQFCCKCGFKTVSQRCGASRKCTNDACKSSSYPRLEPASIMLITDKSGENCLLGRKAVWPEGRYSALSGFTEVGETLEQTVTRETFEEAGVVVDPNSLRLVATQPWPFPSSLMIGYRGVCMEDGLPTVTYDTKEMEDVKWFSKDDVRKGLAGGSTALDGTYTHSCI